MNRLRKALTFAALTLVAAASMLTLKPVRAWASQEGAYIYNQLLVRGPGYFSASRVGGAQGIFITTNTISGGATSSGGVTLPSGGVTLQIIGGQTTAARTACSSIIEGQMAYDPTVHSLCFCDGTTWHKLVYTSSTGGDSWTSY